MLVSDLLNRAVAEQVVPQASKLVWMDEVLAEIARDDAVREFFEHFKRRADTEVEKVNTVVDVLRRMLESEL